MRTSYFANMSNIGNPLSISGEAPEWYTGPQYRVLAPKWNFFKKYKSGEIDETGYIVEYYKQVLDALDPYHIYSYLTGKYDNDVVLLCYEDPGVFCHRRIVADWFENHLGVVVPELR
jgi:hypothetical protein